MICLQVKTGGAMTIHRAVADAVSQKLYGPLIQFALTVAGNDDPAAMLAQRCLVIRR